MFKEKLKASLVHLILSIVVVTLIIGSILLLLFPQLFIGITNFKEVVLILISVDLILGPALTFIVFQPKKKTLKFDLSVIAAIQISALVYGAYALYQVHPVYITFNVDRFSVVNARDAQPEKAKYDEYKISKFTSGKLAYARLPDDQKKIIEIAIAAAKGEGDLDQHMEYYEPYKNHIDEIISKSLDPELVFSEKSNNGKYSKSSFEKKFGKSVEHYAYLPIINNAKDMIVVLDKKTAKPVTTLNIEPWEISKK